VQRRSTARVKPARRWPSSEVNCAAIPAEPYRVGALRDTRRVHSRARLPSGHREVRGRPTGGRSCSTNRGHEPAGAGQGAACSEEGTGRARGRRQAGPGRRSRRRATIKNLQKKSRKGVSARIFPPPECHPRFTCHPSESGGGYPVACESIHRETCSRNGMAVKKIADRAMMALGRGRVGRKCPRASQHRRAARHHVLGDTIEEAAPDAASPVMKSRIFWHTSRSFQEFKDRAEATFIKRQPRAAQLECLKDRRGPSKWNGVISYEDQQVRPRTGEERTEGDENA